MSLAPDTRRPTLMWCYALLAPAVIFVLTGVDRSYQTDLWHHLARGREICATGRIVSVDVFTYTVAGQGFVDNNWLTQVAGWHLYRLGGMDLVQAVNSLLLSGTIALLVWLGMRLGASPRVAAGVGVAMVAGLSQTLLIRPQTVSMLLFAILMTLLVTRRFIWAAPAIIALWANVHGAFPIGVVLIGCFAIARRQWQDFALLGLAVIATLANPYGWHVYEYVQATSSRATSRVIQEWMQPDVTSFHGGFWIATILIVAALAILSRERSERPDGAHSARGSIILLAVFAFISATSVRMSIWWYLVAGPIAMMLWPRTERQASPPSPIATVAYSSIVGMMAICLPAWQAVNPVFAVRPADRTEQILQQLVPVIPASSRIFCRLEWGEYFGFVLPWQHSVFMDGRIEIYGDGIWDQYRRISSAEADWQDLLDRHGVNVLVLDSTYHAGLFDRVPGNPNWRPVASAGTATVFVRGGVDSSALSAAQGR